MNRREKQLNCHYIIFGWRTSKLFLTNHRRLSPLWLIPAINVLQRRMRRCREICAWTTSLFLTALLYVSSISSIAIAPSSSAEFLEYTKLLHPALPSPLGSLGHLLLTFFHQHRVSTGWQLSWQPGSRSSCQSLRSLEHTTCTSWHLTLKGEGSHLYDCPRKLESQVFLLLPFDFLLAA